MHIRLFLLNVCNRESWHCFAFLSVRCAHSSFFSLPSKSQNAYCDFEAVCVRLKLTRFKMRLIWKNFPIYRIRNGWEWNALHIHIRLFEYWEERHSQTILMLSFSPSVPFCSIHSFSFAIVFIYFRRHLFTGKLLFRSNLSRRNWIYHRHHRSFTL